MEDYKKLKADYDRMSAAAQQKIIAEHVATRDAEIARLNLRVAQLTSGSEAANLAGRVVEQDAEIARLRAALAAGPAALRIDARDGIPWGPYKQLPVEEAVATVEAAQEAAMKEGK